MGGKAPKSVVTWSCVTAASQAITVIVFMLNLQGMDSVRAALGALSLSRS